MTQNIMKKSIFLVTAVLVTSSIMAMVFPLGTYASEPQKVVTGQHPRILLTDPDVESLRAKIAAGDEVTTLMHETIMAQAESFMGKPDDVLKHEYDVSGRRILHWSRKAIVRIASCAYAYRFTGEARFLDHALEDMRTVCMFPDWNAHKHFLDAGEMALAVGVGYDWLYKDIPLDLRALVEKRVRDYAYSPSRNPSKTFYRMINNWNQVCNCGLVVSALGIFEPDEPNVKAIVDSCVRTNRKPQAFMYSPDGNYIEGSGYWNYGTSFEVLMLAVMEDVLGTDFGLSEVEGFMKTGDYMNFMYGAVGQFFNYVDNSSRECSSPALWYFALKQGRPELLYHDMQLLREGRYVSSDAQRLLPLLMGFVARMDVGSIDRPSEKYYSGRGATPVIVVHTDWTFSETDKYLGFKGGAMANSHGHGDAGTFVYDAYGYRWAMEYDHCAYASYEKRMAELGGNLWDPSENSMRWNLFRYNNRQHNTLTINDKNHTTTGAAKIVDEFREGRFLGGSMDMTPVFGDDVESASRTVRLVDESYLEVRDEVTAPSSKPVHVRWTMVTPSEVSVAGAVSGTGGSACVPAAGPSAAVLVSSRESSSASAILRQGKVRMRLSTTATGARISYRTWSADPADYGSKFADIEKPIPGVSHVGFESDIPAGATAVFVTTLKRR